MPVHKRKRNGKITWYYKLDAPGSTRDDRAIIRVRDEAGGDRSGSHTPDRGTTEIGIGPGRFECGGCTAEDVLNPAGRVFSTARGKEARAQDNRALQGAGGVS